LPPSRLLAARHTREEQLRWLGEPPWTAALYPTP